MALESSIFHRIITDKLKEEQTLRNWSTLPQVFLENVELLDEIIAFHRYYFATLYIGCKKGPDPFMRFQFQWHDHCSSLLLSEQHSLSEIGLEELPSASIQATRSKWLSFCETSNVPVPDSNPVIILVPSSIYAFLLEYSKNFQNAIQAEENCSKSTTKPDTDDVYYHFGGAAICDMLHLRYKQLTSCSDDICDKLSQEVSILQTIARTKRVYLDIFAIVLVGLCTFQSQSRQGVSSICKGNRWCC